MDKLEPETLAQHAEALVTMLEHSDDQVRHLALQTLCRLDPAALAQYADASLASGLCVRLF